MIAAAFDTASRLFGLRFKELQDAPRYHPDVRAWEVTDKRGEHVGAVPRRLFRAALEALGRVDVGVPLAVEAGGRGAPIIVNVMNFARGAEGEPTLLSFDDARTLFHEFGHGLHGLLSDVTYPSLAGTAVTRDFVELPSQLYEHWLMVPEVLEKFALHHETGKPMPASCCRASRRRATSTRVSRPSSTWPRRSSTWSCTPRDRAALDVDAFERDTLERLGMPREIVMRHRIPHFLHIMGGYAAGYYSYLWSEVMDADAFAAFEETGDVFDAATAKKLHKFIYSGGNGRDPLEAYVAFRGRPPEIHGLLKKRGLAG